MVIGSLLLISAGLYNGYPLVTSDTGTYLNSALNLTVPDDRPITYGLFVLATSLRFSLWIVIFIQGLLLAWLLLSYLSWLVPRLPAAGRLAIVGIVTWGTGVSWFCSQLMPDIFTAIGLLALGLILLQPNIGGFKGWVLALLLLISAIMHSSNLVTFSLTMGGIGLAVWRKRLFPRKVLARSRFWLTCGLVGSAWILLPTVHAAFGGGFTLTRASPTFLVARLVEAGVMDKFLSRNCGPENNYQLCAFRDQLPNDAIAFLWDGNSPLYKTGGWDANLPEYRRILHEIATTPRYYPYLASELVQATLRQLTHVGLGDGLTANRENTNPYWKVGELVSYELKEYMSSLQNRSALSFDNSNERAYGSQLWALLLLTIGLGYSKIRQQLSPAVLLVITVFGLGILSNALVTGGLANILDRLQSRVAWLMPFGALLLTLPFALRLGTHIWHQLRAKWV